MPKVDRLFSLLLTIFDLLLDALRFIRHSLQPRCTLAAENLFLRKQLISGVLQRTSGARRFGGAGPDSRAPRQHANVGSKASGKGEATSD
jgi:hypothetical protein